jgi:methylated-DNA-protein-cysteine methyltransferase-like protein
VSAVRSSSPAAEPSRWRRIWRQVERIPRGRVATYGQIAELAGLPGHARQVGYALAALPEGSSTPWQRVVNARGELSARSEFDAAPRQRLRLLEEGVVFDAAGRIDLKRFRWRPRRRASGDAGRPR